jgi:hypothetical protein
MARKVVKWFEPGRPIGWRKDMPQEERIRTAVRSRRGNLLKAARALLALANVTQDKETERKARADAELLFKRYRKQKGGD